MIRLKRVYDPPSPDDGYRILVDRLWPRGLSKSKAKVDLWLKEVAPTDDLRKWFAHDPAKWTPFRKRYFAELKSNAKAVALIREKAKRSDVTLLYGAKDERQNNAVALHELLTKG